ncbi:MAG: quinolinate synthase NadA [bacterium]|nr:quinolinate synthase NadA [bacterium]
MVGRFRNFSLPLLGNVIDNLFPVGPQENDSFLFANIPTHYYQTPIKDLLERGRQIKQQMGEDLLILAHHYQQDDTFALADHSGDSLYLAQQAAKAKAKYIVFCGVHFMVESSDILTPDHQISILPNLTAGCSMADMADHDAVEEAMDIAEEVTGAKIIPVTYINSTAAIKALTAERGGSVCTSSNSRKILEWALSQGDKVFFFPDQFLGANTAIDMGIPKDEILLWDRQKHDGGVTAEQLKRAKIILWDGFCSVHQRFTPAHVAAVRQRIPGVQVMVHPECPVNTVEAADFSGSTSQILNKVSAAKPGSKWAIGTEINMVNRMARDLKKKGIYVEVLNPTVCICSTMYRNHPAHVLWVLDHLVKGEVIHQISVPEPTKTLARKALDKMLELSK